MTTKELHEVLCILLKVQPNEDIAVDHDGIFIGKYKPELLTDREIKRMEELDFFKNENSWYSFV